MVMQCCRYYIIVSLLLPSICVKKLSGQRLVCTKVNKIRCMRSLCYDLEFDYTAAL